MKVTQTAPIWCAVLGMIVGFVGTPMLIPGTTNVWIWQWPSGYQLASVCIAGTLGFLVGAFIREWPKYWNSQPSHIRMYLIAMIGLMIGLSSFYQHEEVTTNNAWDRISYGLGRVVGADMNITTRDLSPADIRTQGGGLITAGADLGNAEPEIDSASLASVASAVSQVGYYMVDSHRGAQFEDAKKFLQRMGAVIQDSLNAHHGTFTRGAMRSILDRINVEIPQEFRQQWPPV